MSDLIHPGVGVLFMKVGTHAQEGLDDIIARKQKEIDEAGFALWGYGGNTCHPTSMVQPFARDYEQRDEAIYLCMQPMLSNHFAMPERATESSADGVNWEPIPEAINVLGSRFALAIQELRPESLALPLSQTRVAVGPSTGRQGDKYVQGRVDKACLEVIDPHPDPADDEPVVDIGLVARLVDPFAVFVR